MYPTFNGLAYSPESSTLLLLGLGAVMVRTKRS
ncbi:MAG: PEP-CTERM sorting domain-containing protein [Planctomycetota bacterium]